MSGDRSSRGWTAARLRAWVDGRLGAWVPVCLRALAFAILAPAGAMKFLDYRGQVTAFVEYGVPAAEAAVLLVGAVELVAAVALAVGVAARLAALAVAPVMVAAMALYAVVPSNAAVLLACVGVVALGPGTYAYWEPDAGAFGPLSRVLPTGT